MKITKNSPPSGHEPDMAPSQEIKHILSLSTLNTSRNYNIQNLDLQANIGEENIKTALACKVWRLAVAIHIGHCSGLEFERRGLDMKTRLGLVSFWRRTSLKMEAISYPPLVSNIMRLPSKLQVWYKTWSFFVFNSNKLYKLPGLKGVLRLIGPLNHIVYSNLTTLNRLKSLILLQKNLCIVL